MGTRLPDRPSDGMSLVAGVIVHHHHVLWCQRRQAETFDVDTKHASTDPLMTQGASLRSRRKLVAKITQRPITAEAVLVCNIAHRHHLNNIL